ncbi:MAG: tetraacyldisaccharide 4'-kinase [Candidatus Ratteibacteria bacterium]
MESLEPLLSALLTTRHKTKLLSNRVFSDFFHREVVSRAGKSFAWAIWAALTLPFTPFWLLTFFIARFRPAINLSVPSISVGNIEMGGTGKTPLVLFIAQYLVELHYSVAIVCYGTRSTRWDEARLLSQHLSGAKIYSGRNKVLLAKQAIQEGASCILFDDAFHHFRIQQKLDIVLINPSSWPPILFPAGRYRMPIRFLRYADIILSHTPHNLQKKEKKKVQKRFKTGNTPLFFMHPSPRYLESSFGREESLSKIAHNRVLAFCGIGNPDSFLATIHSLKPASVELIRFPDHFSYTKEDILAIHRRFKDSQADLCLTTSKDMVKIKPFLRSFEIFILHIETEIEEKEIFLKYISNYLTKQNSMIY